jgi:DNA polymerase I-like protein with 3'-5' exonuclease and polymerase domains
MYLAFLCAPHARKHDLKSLSADMLGRTPDERDEVAEWVWEHREQLHTTYGGTVSRAKPGPWVFACPGGLIGRYACADADMTHDLYQYLAPVVEANGMWPALDRERKLYPILAENERVGIRVDLPLLTAETEGYGNTLSYVEDWLRRELCASGLEFDNDRDVSSVLLERGIVPSENWTMTEKSGQLSTAKGTLRPEHFTGPNGAQIASALGYRNRLVTCLKMFMQPWLEQAARRNGYISTNWSQTRGEGGGTRTGRTSTSNPNISNISKDFETKGDGYVHPSFLDVARMPLVRKYILPDEGGVLLHRDFDGQELRIFADFECGELYRQYLADPKLDPHAFIAGNVADLTGDEAWRSADRRTLIKGVNFGKLYGAGIPRIKELLKSTDAAARDLNSVHERAMPGRKILSEEIKLVVGRGEPIRTWGGRLYYPEPPSLSKKHGRWMTYEYKLLNYLVQGSAADYTKECLIQWHGHPKRTPGSRFLVTIYDELDLTAAKEHAKHEMAILKEVMEEPRLDIQMLTTGKYGPSWGSLVKGDPE